MSDIVSIELLLDPITEARVRQEWDALAAVRLSSLAAHTAPSNRPHITLLVRTSLAPFDASELTARLPVPLTLGAPLLFGVGDRRILVRSVVPSAKLLGLHAALHESVRAGDDAEHTRPGEWMPHVSLARRLKLTDLPAALRFINGELQGHAVELRRWDAASKTITTLG